MTEVSEHQEPQLPNPTPEEQTPLKSGLEWIGGALAMVHEGIPISEPLQKKLFSQVISGEEPPRLDYVNLATDELLPPTDEAVLQKHYEKAGVKFPAVQKVRELFSPKARENKRKALADAQKAFQENADITGNEFLNSTYQQQDFGLRLRKIFKINEKDENEELFLESIKNSPNKPFLIVRGHGSGSSGSWQIGEETSGRLAPLEDVFKRMGVGAEKYSAILLISCNADKIEPPKLDDTPIFYVEGNTGIEAEHISKVA